MRASIVTALGAAFGIAASAAVTSAQAQGKNPAGVNPTHYECYHVAPVGDVRPLTVRVTDQFGAATVKVLKPFILCVPASKNGVPVKDKRTRLVCYAEEGANTVDRKVVVTNQFGKQTLAVGEPSSLCVPSRETVR
jgi:hypothetical protein